jgi:hypothetical protein
VALPFALVSVRGAPIDGAALVPLWSLTVGSHYKRQLYLGGSLVGRRFLPTQTSKLPPFNVPGVRRKGRERIRWLIAYLL